MIGEFPKIRVSYFGVLIIRILLFRVLHLFLKLPFVWGVLTIEIDGS